MPSPPCECWQSCYLLRTWASSSSFLRYTVQTVLQRLLSFFKMIYFYFMYICVFASMCVHGECKIPWNWSHIHSCELLGGCWELNPCTLEEQPVLLAAEPSLWLVSFSHEKESLNSRLFRTGSVSHILFCAHYCGSSEPQPLKFCRHLHKEHRCPRTSWVPATTQTPTPPSHIDKNISHSHKQKTDPDMRNLNSAKQEIAKDSRSMHLLIQWVMCAVDSDAGTRFVSYFNVLTDISLGNYNQKHQKDNFQSETGT